MRALHYPGFTTKYYRANTYPDHRQTYSELLEKPVEQQAAPAPKKEEEKQWYEEIDIAVGETGVLQGSSGAKEGLSPKGDVTDGSASFDLELTIPVAQ